MGIWDKQTVNKQDYFGHGVLNILVSRLLFAYDSHYFHGSNFASKGVGKKLLDTFCAYGILEHMGIPM